MGPTVLGVGQKSEQPDLFLPAMADGVAFQWERLRGQNVRPNCFSWKEGGGTRYAGTTWERAGTSSNTAAQRSDLASVSPF